MSDNPRVNVIRRALERRSIPARGVSKHQWRAGLEGDAEAILEALDKHDDDLVASMPRAFPDSVEVRVEVVLPDRLQPDRAKQKNGARVLLSPESVAPGLAANIGPTVEVIIGDAAQTIIDGVWP